MSQSTQSEPVIIIGGGPVGMVTALTLNSHGLPVRILESGPDEVRSEWRGSTVHPPTIEILDDLGLGAEILDNAVHLDRLIYRDLELEGEASFEYSLLDNLTRFPFRIQYEQYKLIHLLKNALIERDIETLYNHELVGLDQDDRSVSLDVETTEGPKRFSSQWAIAADGAHSAVRKLLTIPFPGFTYPFQSLVAATPFPFEDFIPDLPPVSYWTGPRGRFSLIRTPDIWRIALSTGVSSDETYEQVNGRPHDDFNSDIKLLFDGEVDPLTMELKQHQMYRTHQRLAETFRAGRIVLAGDAAHLTSTTGGMGLNSGIHDAHALGTAFASDDEDAALDAYAHGRRQVAEQFIQPMTTSNRQGTDLSSVEARTERLAHLRKTASDIETAREHLVGTSMLRVSGLM